MITWLHACMLLRTIAHKHRSSKPISSHLHHDLTFFSPLQKKLEFQFRIRNALVRVMFSAFLYKNPQINSFYPKKKDSHYENEGRASPQIRTCVLTRVLTYAHILIKTCLPLSESKPCYIYTHTKHEYMHACTQNLQTHVSFRNQIHSCTQVYIHTYIHTYIHFRQQHLSFTQAWSVRGRRCQTWMLLRRTWDSIHTYTPTYIHTYIHTLQTATPQLHSSMERARSTLSDMDASQEDKGLNPLQFDENDLNNAAMVPKLMSKLIQHINSHSK
jgi:hypothetical protein